MMYLLLRVSVPFRRAVDRHHREELSSILLPLCSLSMYQYLRTGLLFFINKYPFAIFVFVDGNSCIATGSGNDQQYE
jgi:hypothetical protein